MSMSIGWHDETSPSELARWIFAALVVVGIHAGAAIYLLAVHEPDIVGSNQAVEQDFAPAPETMVESSPLPDAPQPKPQEDMKVERPPDEAPTEVPLPVEKPPEKAQTSPPPAPVTAQRVKGGAPTVEPSWQTGLMRQLQRFKRYPASAQSHKEEGVVLLSFSLDRSGHVLTRSIARSSGHPDLDDEVMAMIVRAEPLPPFPASMTQDHVDLTVPIRFSLR
jgi:periplasmic protein TonB